MGHQNNKIIIKTRDGKTIRIPRQEVHEILLPSVNIAGTYHRIRLTLDNIDHDMRKYIETINKILG